MLTHNGNGLILSQKTGSRWISKILKDGRGWKEVGGHHGGVFHQEPGSTLNTWSALIGVTIRDPRDVLLTYFYQGSDNTGKATLDWLTKVAANNRFLNGPTPYDRSFYPQVWQAHATYNCVNWICYEDGLIRELNWTLNRFNEPELTEEELAIAPIGVTERKPRREPGQSWLDFYEEDALKWIEDSFAMELEMMGYHRDLK